MHYDDLQQEIEKLTVAERISLAGDIWDSIASNPDNLPLSPELKAELDRRQESFQRNPDQGRDWEDVKADILRKIAL